MRRFGRSLILLILIAQLPAQLAASQSSDCASADNMPDMAMAPSGGDQSVGEPGGCCDIKAGVEESSKRSPAPDCLTSLPCANTPALPPSDRTTVSSVSTCASNILTVAAPIEPSVAPEAPPPRY